MNLRDKLRDQAGEHEAHGVVSEAAAKAPAKKRPAAGGKAKPKARQSLLPAFDVNRRFLVLAGAAAAMTAIMVVMYIGNSASGLSEGGTKITVFVAKDNLGPGVKLTDDNLETRDVPKAYLPTGFYAEKDKAKLLERLTIAPMVAGQPLIEAQTSAPDAKYGIAYLLKSGERAKTISVNSASGLAGLIKPGNEVDLIATIQDPNNDARRIGTPILQKARVVAVGDHLLGEVKPAATSDDQSNHNNQDGSGISSQGTITLAVPAKKVGLVTLLEDLGSLKVVLRAASDDTIVTTQFSDDTIMSLVSGKVPPKEAPKPTPVVHTPTAVVHTVYHEQPQPRPHPVVHHEAPKPHPTHAPIAHAKPKPHIETPHNVQVIQFHQ